MPGKHKNKKKAKQVQIQTGLFTPPDTPTPSDDATVSPESSTLLTPEESLRESYVRDPAIEAIFTKDLKHFVINPRPMNVPPLPTLNSTTESGHVLPVNYNRWPVRGVRGDLLDELDRGVDGTWVIGGSALRNRIFGLYPVDTFNGGPFTVCTMLRWLMRMESQALDLPYTLAEWQQYCLMVWKAISMIDSEDAEEMSELLMESHLLQLGRQPPDAPDDSYRYTHLIALPSPHCITGDIIQHCSTYEMGITRRMDPIRGEIATNHFTDPDAWLKLSNDMNALCVIVDMNNKLRPTAFPFRAADRQAVLEYYAGHPIQDHVQALPSAMTTFIEVNGEPLWTSTKEIGECEAITIKELIAPKRHAGRSLLCRVLTRCRVHGGISFVVEDTNGQPIPVTVVYPFPFPAIVYSPATVQSLWPVGTCLYIKEPYIRCGPRGRAEVLVAWPKDMVEISPVAGVFDDPDLAPATNILAAYRLAASMAFIQARPQLAIRLATIGINLVSLPHLVHVCEENEVHHLSLLKGRATTHWLRGQPGAAYSDCLKIEKLMKTCDPVLVPSEGIEVEPIRLQAAYKLRLFTAASRHLKTCERMGINPRTLQPYREAIKLREQEISGEFSVAQGPLDAARSLYIGPIKVVTDPIKGRKIITTRPVKSGEVVLVEEPVVDQKYDGSPGVFCFMAKSGQATPKRSPNSVAWAVHQVMDDPSLGQCIQSLSPEPNLESNNLGLTDEERLGCFQQPREIDVDLMERQIGRNAFGGDNKYSLYGLISMMSHSCKPNIVKAEQNRDEASICYRVVNDMAEGEEIFVSYIPFDQNYKIRHQRLKNTWYFECQCELCLADKGDRHEARGIMMGGEWLHLQDSASEFTHPSGPRYGSTLLAMRPTIARLLKFASKVNATYSSDRTAKPELSEVYFELGDLWATSDASEALKYYETGYRYLDWDLYTAKEMKTSNKLVKKYGYFHLSFLEHAHRLKVMKELYQRKKMAHASDACKQSLINIIDLHVSPTMDREVVIRDYLNE